MRIAHIITRFVRGGADENTLLSCNAQAEAGHEVLLIHGRETAPAIIERLHPAVERREAHHLVRPLSPVSDLICLYELTGQLSRFRAEIVHTHTSKAGILGRAAAKLAGAPGIVHGVHIAPFLNVGVAERLVYLAAERLLALITDMFVDVSDGMRQACLDNGVGAPAKHVVIPSGMDVDAFRNAQRLSAMELSTRLGITPEAAQAARIVLMVAAFEPRKRQTQFLDVFAKALEQTPEARLVLLGEGHSHDAVVGRVRELGLEGKVFLPGFQEDVERWMATAEICALVSEREGLPRVIVQYALAARPIVVTALPGVGQVVKEGQTGFIIPVDDVAAATGPLVSLLSNSNLREQMSKAAGRLDLSAWGTGAMVAALDDVYAGVLTRRATR